MSEAPGIPVGAPDRLIDLNAKLTGTLEDGVLTFDCPFSEHSHRLRVHVHRAPFAEKGGVRYWQATGEFPDTLTLSPSINACTEQIHCWHGFIRDGRIA